MDKTEKQTYDFKALEPKWQQYWLSQQTFRSEDFSQKPKYYILDMFPYPSGNGLHVGHAEGYTATDIIARYKRAQGFNVLHPMGWDAFGLPAEQYALKTGTHPRETTATNIANYKRQIQRLGYSTDWSREINTTDPKYYKWTQWIFLQLWKKGLAYQSFAPVNWCPALGTVLANEEVVDGRSEVGGHPVEKRPLRQWVLKITAYAERLLEDLEGLDWPESTKEMQRHWIGKSTGAEIDFAIQGHPEHTFKAFTTRADTLFGATFCVLAPEHPLVPLITTPSEQASVNLYREASSQKSDMDRTAGSKDKSGVFTGAYALNPCSHALMPVYIADYVLMSYGTGAIMAVPGHDERDHAFARKYNLPIVRVLSGGPDDLNEAAHPGSGTLMNSGFLNGLNKDEALEKIYAWLESSGLGKKTVTYRLKDWIFSRQRYWGEPFPLSHDSEGRVVAHSEAELPITLPEVDDYRPTADGEPPLAKASSWVHWEKDGVALQRETNIMPQWAGSCWYYLRYLDPHNVASLCDLKKEQYWLPVDLYVGGVEHANLHLLYARFWHKVLYDLGYVSCKEPFVKLRHPGLVLGSNGEKMSKSRGNVVNPEDLFDQWGADALRLYEMFMGPFDQVKPWQTNGIVGAHRFLKRLWSLCISEEGELSAQIQAEQDSAAVLTALHKTIKRVSEETEALKFNTAIAAMMEFLNAIGKDRLSRKTAQTFILLVAPYAPHIAEELWQRLGHNTTLAYEPWPQHDPELVKTTEVTISIMIGGKLRATIALAPDCPEAEALRQAQELPSVQKHLEGKKITKCIYVPGKILNLVVA